MSSLNKEVDYLLVDGNNLAFRSFYGVKYLSNQQQLPVNAIYGFFNSLHTLQQTVRYQHLVVCFDCGRSQRRTQLLDTYKANRAETPEDFKLQLPYIKQLIPLMGGTCCEESGIEADDIIGSLCQRIQQEHRSAAIVSADKDLMQCVCATIDQMIPTPQGWARLASDDVKQKMGVRPEQIVDFLALMGDSADNYPGIPGVGPKTAMQWLSEYDNLETLYQNLATLRPERFREILAQSKDLLQKNKQLAALDCNPAYAETFWEKIHNVDANLTALSKALEDLGLKRLAQKFKPLRCEQTELF
jgi:5''-3'' exonuclease (including N-terminal domain of PolI)